MGMLSVRLAGTLSVCAFLVFAAGCGDTDVPVAPDIGSGVKMRVVHASPDAPAVDVYVEGVASPLIVNLGYGATSEYVNLRAGIYNVQVRVAGEDPGSPPAFETGGLAIPDGTRITAIAAGLLDDTGPQDAFRIMPLVEDFVSPGAGEAIVRFVHAGADAPAATIDLGDDGDAEIAGLERFADSAAAGIPLTAGEYLQTAIWAGSPLARITAFTVPALPAQTEIFMIATGLLSGHPSARDGFGLLSVGPSGSSGFLRQNPVVFALHVSPDTPAVDIYGGTEFVASLSFGELSAGIQVPHTGGRLEFRAVDNGTVAATAEPTFSLSVGRYLAAATGFLGDADFAIVRVEDGFSLDGASPLVRVVNASPDASLIDVGVVDGGFTPVPDFRSLSYGGASAEAGTALPAGNLRIGVAAAGTTSPAATFDVNIVPGVRAFFVVSGSLLGAGEAFRLVVVDTSVYPWTAAEVFPNP